MLPPMTKEALLTMFHLNNRTRLLLKDRNLVKEALKTGKSPQAILEFSSGEMALLYKCARQLFTEGKYSDATDAFLFLSTLNDTCQEYWLGLGMSLQMEKHYEAAVDAYEIAATCDIESPIAYFYLAKCLFALNDRESAMEALAIAIEYAGDQEEFQELKHQAESALDILIEDEGDAPDSKDRGLEEI